MNSLVRSVLLLAAGFFLIGASPAIAKEKWVVLVRVKNPAPGDWQAQLQASADAAQQLRKNVEWLPPPQLSIEEASMLMGCTGWDAECVALVGGSIQADRALSITVEERGGKPVLIHQQVVVKTSAPKPEPTPEPEPEPEPEEEDDTDYPCMSWTKGELQEYCDDNKVEYKVSFTKTQLLEVIDEHFS